MPAGWLQLILDSLQNRIWRVYLLQVLDGLRECPVQLLGDVWMVAVRNASSVNTLEQPECKLSRAMFSEGSVLPKSEARVRREHCMQLARAQQAGTRDPIRR
jgi:hypothetical protein